jgi:ABC-type branched-subunit amino acid transport system ATPase component
MSALENVMVGASPRLRMGLPSSLLSAPAIRRETREIRDRASSMT